MPKLLLTMVFFLSSLHAVYWRYEGERGPENWAKLQKNYKQCQSGKAQSPVDIINAKTMALKPLSFHYTNSDGFLMNQAHSVKVEIPKGNHIFINKKQYDLLRVYIRVPSEHTVEGKNYAAELQLVHENSKKELAVVSVFFEEGKSNYPLFRLLSQFPKKPAPMKPYKGKFNPKNLLPNDKSYYFYKGSMSFPPCKEGVKWFILKEPMSLSKSQLYQIKMSLPKANNRPTQPLHNRSIFH